MQLRYLIYKIRQRDHMPRIYRIQVYRIYRREDSPDIQNIQNYLRTKTYNFISYNTSRIQHPQPPKETQIPRPDPGSKNILQFTMSQYRFVSSLVKREQIFNIQVYDYKNIKYEFPHKFLKNINQQVLGHILRIVWGHNLVTSFIMDGKARY